MKQLLAAFSLAAALLSLSAKVHAFSLPLPGGCGVSVSCEEKVVTGYRPEWQVRQVPTVVYRTVCREQVVAEKSYTTIPVWSEQKRTVYVYKKVPKEVEREVTVLLPAPPCPGPDCLDGPGCGHGCAHGSCNFCNRPTPATVTQKFKTIEFQEDSTPVDFIEKVCTYKAQEHSNLVRRPVVEQVPETVMRTEVHCVLVPFHFALQVPACLSGCWHP